MQLTAILAPRSGRKAENQISRKKKRATSGCNLGGPLPALRFSMSTEALPQRLLWPSSKSLPWATRRNYDGGGWKVPQSRRGDLVKEGPPSRLLRRVQGLNNGGQAQRLASSNRYDGGRALPRLLSNLLLCGPMIATHGKTKLEQQRFPP